MFTRTIGFLSTNRRRILPKNLGALLTLVVLGTAAASCGDQSMTVVDGPGGEGGPHSLQAADGNGQVGTVGTVLPKPLSARVVTSDGRAVEGATITWTFAKGSGAEAKDGQTSETVTSLTDKFGLASVYWRLDTIAGDQEATAALAPGTNGSPSSRAKFKSQGKPAAPDSIALSPASATISVGQPLQLRPTVLDKWGNVIAGAPVTWSSSRNNVASVNSSGTVTAKASGKTTIDAKSDKADGYSAITVTTSNFSNVANITVDLQSTTLTALGATTQLSATATDGSGATVQGVEFTWTVLNTAVASVDSTGLVMAEKNGATSVVVSAPGTSAADTVAVTVSQQAASIAISPDSLNLTVGGTAQLTATVLDANDNAISGATVAWSSNDTTVATVTAQGLVTARDTGSAMIMASTTGPSGASALSGPSTVSSVTSGAAVSVSTTAADPATVSDLRIVGVTSNSVTLRWTQVDDGTGSPAKYALRYATPSLSWGSAYATEVSVSGTKVGDSLDYTFTGLQSGTTYEFGVVTYRGTLNVDAVFGAVSNFASGLTSNSGGSQTSSITVTPASLTLPIGSTAQLSAVATDSTGNTVSNPGFTWTSSDSSIASVSASGLVTARAIGTTAIIVAAACCGSYTEPVTVTSGQTQAAGEPFPSDSNAVDVISETFESYSSSSDFLSNGPWTIEQNPGGNSINIDTGQHYQGSKSLRMTLPAGGSQVLSPHLWHRLSGFSDTFSTNNFQFYIKASGDWENGKGVILHNAKEGQSRPCGGSYYRYQMGMSGQPQDQWPVGPYRHARWFPKPEDDGNQGGCDGPINNASTSQPYPGFVWQGRNSDFESAPLISSDEGINRAPWSGLDDGNWHRMTFQIRIGSGSNGWLKCWIDGYLVYDSTNNPNGYASRPTTFNWEWYAAFGRSTTTQIWVDNNTFWQSR